MENFLDCSACVELELGLELEESCRTSSCRIAVLKSL